MASLRIVKREIDFLVSEVISDCYTCLYFNAKNKSEVVAIMEETVELRNQLIISANHPAEKHNPRLVKKHYQQLRQTMFDKIDEQFEKLSNCCKA